MRAWPSKSPRSRSVRLPYVFKASYDKANRSSGRSYRGPGPEVGLRILARVRSEIGVPVLSDIHEPTQAAAAREVLDCLQVPAFLCRQTDLLLACGKTGRCVNIKKGQFLAPEKMQLAVDKVRETGNANVLVTDRGTFFGYERLVNDLTGLQVMRAFARSVRRHAFRAVPRRRSHVTGGRASSSRCARGRRSRHRRSLMEVHDDPPNARATRPRSGRWISSKACCTSWSAFAKRSRDVSRAEGTD